MSVKDGITENQLDRLMTSFSNVQETKFNSIQTELSTLTKALNVLTQTLQQHAISLNDFRNTTERAFDQMHELKEIVKNNYQNLQQQIDAVDEDVLILKTQSSAGHVIRNLILWFFKTLILMGMAGAGVMLWWFLQQAAKPNAIPKHDGAPHYSIKK